MEISLSHVRYLPPLELPLVEPGQAFLGILDHDPGVLVRDRLVAD